MRMPLFIVVCVAIISLAPVDVRAENAAVDTASAHHTWQDSIPWRSSLYLGAGYGWPNGARFEIGGNFGSTFTFGMHLTIFNGWASDPEEGMFGFVLRVNVPIEGWPVTPYMQFMNGSQLEISYSSSSASPDHFVGFQVGAIYSPLRFITLRPELGILMTVVDEPWVKSNDTFPSFHLQCDLIVFELFR